MMSRAKKGLVSDWWWTVDKAMLSLIFLLLGGGILLSFSASPPVAERLGLDSFHFVKRHAMFLVPAVLVLIGTSFLNLRQLRRLVLVVLLGSIVALMLIPFIGFAAKGATRWLALGPFLLQPLFRSIRPEKWLKNK